MYKTLKNILISLLFLLGVIINFSTFQQSNKHISVSESSTHQKNFENKLTNENDVSDDDQIINIVSKNIFHKEINLIYNSLLKTNQSSPQLSFWQPPK